MKKNLILILTIAMVLSLITSPYSTFCQAVDASTNQLGSTDMPQSLSTRNTEPGTRVDVLIGFTQTPGPHEQDIVRRAGGNIKYTYRLIPGIAANIPESQIPNLLKNPRITIIELDIKVYATEYNTELDNTWGVKRINAGTVHENNNLGTGIKVAVIDSGIDYTHPDLAGNYAGGYDFVNNTGDPMDDNGHGTHVAGTIAALRNGKGVVGAAPEVQIYALKVLGRDGSGSYSDVIKALEWSVSKGIQITNNSYGSSGDPGTLVQKAFDNSYASGILHVASAGNSGNPAGRGDSVGYPAKYETVIAVSAIGKDDKRANWSSTGPDVELTAPGVSINSTLAGGGYGTKSGTSMASPHVAGTAALVMSAGITQVSLVRQILTDTAEDLQNPNWYGYGLVNAMEAVAAVIPPEQPEPAVRIMLTTDKDYYVSDKDHNTVITAIVSDEYGNAISGLGSSSFLSQLDDGQVPVIFAETDTEGTYAGSLDISQLDDNSYTIKVAVTDLRNLSDTDTVIFTIGPAPAEPSIVIVSSITYSTSGGRNNNRHLHITVALIDDIGNIVSGASVSIELYRDVDSYMGSSTGTTGNNGTVTFTINNAPSGIYTTKVTDVIAEGLRWEGKTPENSFEKKP